MTASNNGVGLVSPIESEDGFPTLTYKLDTELISIAVSADKELLSWLEDLGTPACSKKFKISRQVFIDSNMNTLREIKKLLKTVRSKFNLIIDN